MTEMPDKLKYYHSSNATILIVEVLISIWTEKTSHLLSVILYFRPFLKTTSSNESLLVRLRRDG